MAFGPIRFGGEQTIAVINNVSRMGVGPETLLSTLEAQLKSSRHIPPEILEWTIQTEEDLDALRKFRRKLQFETSRLGYLARIENSALTEKALSIADGLLMKTRTWPRSRDG
jgi:hypothetical protein